MSLDKLIEKTAKFRDMAEKKSFAEIINDFFIPTVKKDIKKIDGIVSHLVLKLEKLKHTDGEYLSTVGDKDHFKYGVRNTLHNMIYAMDKVFLAMRDEDAPIEKVKRIFVEQLEKALSNYDFSNYEDTPGMKFPNKKYFEYFQNTESYKMAKRLIGVLKEEINKPLVKNEFGRPELSSEQKAHQEMPTKIVDKKIAV